MSSAAKRAERRFSMAAPRLLLGLAVLLAAIVVMRDGRIFAQQTEPTGSGQNPSHPVHGTSSDLDQPIAGDLNNPVLMERRMRQLNATQHKQMVSDTEKLVKLVTELNADINKTAPAALTPDQLRKVAEIEKLAHSVKDKMRSSVQAVPGFLDEGPNIPLNAGHH